jgi:hypothetical protein
MTLPRTLSSYASPKQQVRTGNPETDLCAPEWNRAVADLAALTQTPTKLRVIFPTATSNGAVTPTWFWAQWGGDSASAPAIERTNTGVYTITTPAAWASPGVWVYSIDPTGQTNVSEQVIWSWCKGDLDVPVATADGKVRNTRAGYTITVYVTNTSGALNDLGGAVPIYIEAG